MFYRPHTRRYQAHDDEEITKQSHKAECDINNIIRQFSRTGIFTHVSSRRAAFVDLPDLSDYQAALHALASAEDAFSQLPSLVRDRFQNDPAQLLAALGNPAMRGELQDIGVFEKPARTASAAPTGASGAAPEPAPAPEGNS